MGAPHPRRRSVRPVSARSSLAVAVPSLAAVAALAVPVLVLGFTLKHVVCGLNPLEYPLSSRISSVLVRVVHLCQLTVPGLDLRGGCTVLQPQGFVGIIHHISHTVDSGRDGARARGRGHRGRQLERPSDLFSVCHLWIALIVFSAPCSATTALVSGIWPLVRAFRERMSMPARSSMVNV